jgi:UDP-glucose 4-epimerase
MRDVRQSTAVKKVLAQKIEIRAVIEFAAEGLGCSIEAPFTPKMETRTNGDNHKNFGL